MDNKILQTIRCIHENHEESFEIHSSAYRRKQISDYLFTMYGKTVSYSSEFVLNRVEVICLNKLTIIGSSYHYYKANGVWVSFASCYMERRFQCVVGQSLQGKQLAVKQE